MRQQSGTLPMRHGTWSREEHDKFLKAIELYPDGPWGAISQYVGTRSPRQAQTHAQKYYEKLARRRRGLQRERNISNCKDHRIADLTALSPSEKKKKDEGNDVKVEAIKIEPFIKVETDAPSSPVSVCEKYQKEPLLSFEQSLDFLIENMLLEGSNSYSYRFEGILEL